MKLRDIAESSEWDKKGTFEISKAAFYPSAWCVTDAFKNYSSTDLCIKYFDRLQEMEIEFSLESRHNLYRGGFAPLNECLN